MAYWTPSDLGGGVVIFQCHIFLSVDPIHYPQTHVHWVNDAIQPSYPRLSPSSLALNFPLTRDFCRESVLHIRLPTYWSFSFSIRICPPSRTASSSLQVRILEWVAISHSSGPRFVRPLPYDLFILDALHSMTSSFIELHKPLCNSEGEDNRIGKTWDLLRNIRNIKAIFHVKMGRE